MARSLRMLLLFAAVANAASASSHSSRAIQGKLEANAQLGLKLPAEKDIDFTVVRPALVNVAISQQADADAKSVMSEGALGMTMSINPADSSLHLHSATEKKDGFVQVAWAKYNNTVKKNGWGYLSVGATDSSQVSGDLKMYAAGYLEGLATAKAIRNFQHNAGGGLEAEESKHHALANIQSMFDKEMTGIRTKSNMVNEANLVEANLPKDPFWQQARWSLVQGWGILDAYNRQVQLVNGKAMSMIDLIVLNSDGETPELEMAYDMEEFLLRQSEREGDTSDSSDNSTSFLQKRSTHESPSSRAARRDAEIRGLNDKKWRKIKDSTGHCSALVRLTKDNADILVGHTTFSDYSEMNRIFKYYDFPLGPGSARKMGFSSYPGVAGSTDDYYLMDTGLVVTETTISMLTDEPYDKLDDNNTMVPDYMRIMIANRLAKSGQEWVDVMKRSATGTYCSQWMVVDYNRFQPGKTLQNGTVFVLEQVPGLSHGQDMSSWLQEKKFWASENRPWYKDVRDQVGATEAEEMHGSLFSADQNPRAHIFHATENQVDSLANMRAEMQRNKWPKEVDGGMLNSPDHAISARGDLDKGNPNPNGGVDSKVTNMCLAKKLQCDAISGPTHDDQKPFRWTDEKTGKELFPSVPHDGLPDLWNFDWVRMTEDGQSPTAGQAC